MRKRSLLHDDSGATALEFAMTAPIFFALLIGIGVTAISLYTKVALQHAVERAARCATINTTTCGTATAIKSYAVDQSLGLSPPASTFTVTTPACGNMVQASYPITLRLGTLARKTITLTSTSCFPK